MHVYVGGIIHLMSGSIYIGISYIYSILTGGCIGVYRIIRATRCIPCTKYMSYK